MAFVLQLSDGTTTVDFLGSSGTSWCLLADGGLVIKNPSRKEQWSGGGLWKQGQRLSHVSYENRRISIRFEIVGNNWNNVLDKKTQISQLLDTAMEDQLNGYSPSVYLKYQINSTTYSVYFDVLSGEVEIPDDIMSVEKMNWQKAGGQVSLKDCVVELECSPFARGDELTLVSSGSVNSTDDGLYDNYVSWAGTSVKGDVPGPLRVKVTGTVSKAWLGMREDTSSPTWQSVYEAEDGVAFNGGTPSAQNVKYSGDSGDTNGGYSVDWSISGTTSETKLIHWIFSSTSDIGDFVGKARILAIGEFPTDCLFKIKYNVGLYGTVKEYPYRRNDNETTGSIVFDLGSVDWLPWSLEKNQTSTGWYLELYCKPDDTDSKSIKLDCIIVIPADDRKHRQYKVLVDGPLFQNAIEDNGRTNRVTILEATLHRSTIVEPSGFPLHARPGKYGKLFMTFATYDSEWSPSVPATIDVYHTPYYYDVRGLA